MNPHQDPSRPALRLAIPPRTAAPVKSKFSRVAVARKYLGTHAVLHHGGTRDCTVDPVCRTRYT